MWSIAEHFRVKFGGNLYIDTPTLVGFRDDPFVVMKRHNDNGYLGIDLELHDPSGKKIAVVRRNEIYMVAGAEVSYRVDGSADQYLLIERATDAVLCDIRKRDAARGFDLDVSVRLYTPTGFLFDATPDQTNLGGIKLYGNVFHGSKVGVALS